MRTQVRLGTVNGGPLLVMREPSPNRHPPAVTGKGRAHEPGRGASVVVVLEGELDPRDTDRLCARLREQILTTSCGVVVCDVGDLRGVDLAVVDALCRLQLTARRLGSSVRLRRVPLRLRELLDLVGLTEPGCPEWLIVEPGRQPEHGEVAGGVEEEDDPADPVP